MSFVNKGKLYKDLLSAYTKTYSDTKSKKTIQDNVNCIWNNAKKDSNVTILIENKISQLNKIRAKKQFGLQKFWMGASEKSKASTEPSHSDKENSATLNPENVSLVDSSSSVNENSVAPAEEISTDKSVPLREVSTLKRCYETPAQWKIKNEIFVLDGDIVALKQRANCGLMNDEMRKELKLKTEKLETLRKLIKKKEREMIRHRQRRLQMKININKECAANPNLKKKFNLRDTLGRPRIEEDQPFLLRAIVDLALHGSAAHERRRDETIRTVTTLDDLVTKLREDYGYDLSRSATYLRLLPRKSNSLHGKRHVNTVPVKLIRPSNDLHKKHIDSNFAMTTINHIDELASLLGPNEVTYISQDDKAKVAIGLPAAGKQAPLLMHMEYRVKLPDHGFMIAKGHKLTPSVYGFCEVKPNGGGDRSAISYSGPTIIAIRSSKHSSSTAFSHARDIKNIYEKSEFVNFTHTTPNGVGEPKPKPVFISIVDGGPDENPRYENVAKMNVHHFVKYDLDALIVGCNAPHRSAFNRVERRMAPLSRALVGIILPHEHYGTHLDTQGRTVDVELEKINFSYAGIALAEVWSETTIDGHDIIAKYVQPENSTIESSDIITRDVDWYNRHVFQSQYLLQILKCSDTKCCKEKRSSFFKLMPSSGLPPPISLKQTEDGLKLSNITDIDTYSSLFVTLAYGKLELVADNSKKRVYDFYCPSVQNKLESRTCSCGLYFSSVSSIKSHLKQNFKCKKVVNKIKPVKIIRKRPGEKLALVRYDIEEDVEWVYDIDIEEDENTNFDEPEQEVPNKIYNINVVLTPVWEDE